VTWIIGIDEAGFGPTLGPLVIGGSLWHSRGEVQQEPCFDDWTAGFAVEGVGPIRLADSKQLYSPSSGLKLLEAGLLAALSTIPVRTTRFRDLFELLTERSLNAHEPWYLDWDPSVSRTLDASTVANVCNRGTDCWSRGSLRLRQVAARVIEPREFNSLCEVRGNKATVLTEQSLQLVHRLWQQTEGGSTIVYCDKHGGRNNYAAPLYHLWPDSMLTILRESREQSCYLMTLDGQRTIHWHFTAKGDAHAPTALASMIAKYLRERLMEAFNEFWQRHVPELKPSAGYPADAARYLESITPVLGQLGIDLQCIRRSR
jgi:ribonuclease HII